MMKEIWDAYGADMKKLNITLTRGEKLPDGAFHLVSEIIVRHTDGSFLATKRSPKKKNYPNCWEISAGGSVKSGETPLEAAARELREETGIDCGQLKLIYQVLSEKYHSIYMGYVCCFDGGKDSVTLQQGETCEYVWVKSENIHNFINSENYVVIHADRIKDYFITEKII